MSRSRLVRRIGAGVGIVTVIPFVASLSAIPASAAVTSSTAPQPSIQRVQAAPQIPRGATSLGAVASSAAVSGSVVLKPSNEAGLKAFIAEVTNKHSSMYHHYLAPGAYAAQFGPAPATVAAVKAALQADGLQVTKVASDNLLVSFTGAASQVESAFHTGLNRYRLADGSAGQATTGAVQLPSSIASVVSSVVGLNELVHAHPANIRRGSGGTHPAAKPATFAHPAGSPVPCADATAAAVSSGGLTDDQIANAYGAFGIYNTGRFGAGQHVAVFELEPFLPSDLNTFNTCYFGATQAASMASRLSVMPVDGGQPTGPGSGEAILDVQDVSAMAPAANVDVYEAPNTTFGSIDEYSQIINNTDPATFDHIVTSSWGLCEQAVQTGEPGVQQAENLLFEQAAAQGQTVFSAAGDTGSNDCNAFRTTSPVSPILSVDDPSSQPYVVAVGGTTIDNATQPPSERVWNDGAAWGSGGGGISESWPMPTYQLDSKVPGMIDAATIAEANAFEGADLGNPSYAFCQSDASVGTFETACRQLPDVSAQADEFTGAVTIYAAEFGPGPLGWITIGGTSSAAPIWAGLLALINDSGTSSTCDSPGTGVGFLNPLLYAVASSPAQYAASFNDITAGNNDPYGATSPPLFAATTGYDMATGLGTPQLTGPGGTAGLAYYLCQAAVSPSRPGVTGLSPSVGSTSSTGGTPVVITGSGFKTGSTDNVADVQVGSVQFPVASGLFTVDSATQISAVIPPANYLVPPGDPTDGAGGYQVSVTLTDGETSMPTANSLFEYVDQNGSHQTLPAVTSVRAYGGPEAGGNTVDIFGTGFTASTISSVKFGGVASGSFNVLNDFHIQAVVPAYVGGTTTCDQNGSFFSASENATNDICQTQVVVTNAHGSSATSTVLPLYEGSFTFDPNGVIPAPSGEEVAPQPNEYDYVPAPTITSISTDNGPAQLASEFGNTVVTIDGTGFNLATLDWISFGDPTLASSQDFSLVSVSGTEIQIVAPGLPPTTNSVQVPVSVKTLAGQSAPINATYAGIPVVTSVTSPFGPVNGVFGGPDTGGTHIDITGQGFQQAVGPIGFVDIASPFSLGTQYNYTVNSDTDITTLTVPQNPATVDVQVCSVTSCSAPSSQEQPPSTADELVLFPPGDPHVDSVTPSSGPSTGGTDVVISGENLGCVTGVSFGGVPAASFSGVPSFLDCGLTNEVTATSPPGAVGSSVPVTVTTAESDFTGSGPSATTATFTYNPVPPAFTADSPPSIATVGVPYNYTFMATGDPAPTYTVSSGALPPGLHLNAVTGTLAGTPTMIGAFTFEVTASNGASPDAVTPDLSITVTKVPMFTADSPPATALRGTPYTYTFKAAGSPAPTFSVSSGALPAGLHLNAITGVLAGTPTTAGTFVFRVTASNGVSPDAVSPNLTITVAGANTGYRMAGTDGAVYRFGADPSYGSLVGVPLNRPIVGMAATPDPGYWLVASDGGVFTFGSAGFYGSTGNVRLNQPIVGMAPTPSGHGYWLVASDGGIFTFGDAHFYGSTGNVRLNRPIVGMAATPSGHGYWLVASDGGIFTFGDAHFYGSTGNVRLSQPIVAMAATPTGQGYWLVASDGGIFPFGPAAHFLGSAAGLRLNQPIVSMAATPDGLGYGLASSNGDVKGFGDFALFGSLANQHLSAPIVAVTT